MKRLLLVAALPALLIACADDDDGEITSQTIAPADPDRPR